MKEELIVAAAGVLIQAGILIATVKFIQRDVNGIGKKQRSMVAEQIIMAKDHPEFSVIVRKLINGI
jgi:hypothetical protein